MSDERSDLLQSALYRIAETASAAQDMQEFYADIHHIVGELNSPPIATSAHGPP